VTASVSTLAGKRPPTPLEAAIADPAIQDAVYKYALRKLRHEQDAEDLAQTSLEAALRRDRAGTGWKSPPPPVLMFLGSVLNGEVSNKWRTEKRRPKLVEGETEDAASETPHAEDAMVGREAEAERERKQVQVKTELRAYFASKANGQVPVAMLDLAESGVKGGRGLAERIGCSLDEINRGRKRIQHHMDRIAKGLADDELS
jgi:hypothetical protein